MSSLAPSTLLALAFTCTPVRISLAVGHLALCSLLVTLLNVYWLVFLALYSMYLPPLILRISMPMHFINVDNLFQPNCQETGPLLDVTCTPFLSVFCFSLRRLCQFAITFYYRHCTPAFSLLTHVFYVWHSDELDAGRTLNAASTVNGTSMTVELCIQFCDTEGFIYAGTEFGVSPLIRCWSPFHLSSFLLTLFPTTLWSLSNVVLIFLLITCITTWQFTDRFSLTRTNVVRISFRFDPSLQSSKRLITLRFLFFFSIYPVCPLSLLDPLVPYSLFCLRFCRHCLLPSYHSLALLPGYGEIRLGCFGLLTEPHLFLYSGIIVPISV